MNIIQKIFNKKANCIQYELIINEIHRSKRFGLNFGILVLELIHAVPYGLSWILPGKTISYEILKQNLRCYDKIVGPFIRRYYILLPQTDKEGTQVIEKRIKQIAEERKLGTLFIGKAIFPYDGNNVNSLLKKALGKL
jgi:hypothetical protein